MSVPVPKPVLAKGEIRNRIASVMEHVPRYGFKGAARLALDAGVSRSALSRVLREHAEPSYALLARVASAIERQIGRPLDLRELAAEDGEYPTASVCALLGCPGCLPRAAYTEEDELREEYRGVLPGQWSSAPYQGRKEAA